MKLKVTLFILLSCNSILVLSQFIDKVSLNIEVGIQAPNITELNNSLEGLNIPKIPGIFDSFGMGLTLKKKRVVMEIKHNSNYATSDKAIENVGFNGIISFGYEIPFKDDKTIVYPMIGLAVCNLKLVITDSVQLTGTDFTDLVNSRYYNKTETTNLGLLTQIQVLSRTRLDNISFGPYIGYIWPISKSYWNFQGEPLINGPKTNAGGFIFGFRMCFNLEKSD